MLLTMQQVSKGFLDEPVLKNIDLAVREDDRIGLLGVNGVGKSTLLQIAAGVLPCDTGTVDRKKGLRIGYLRQNEALDSENTLEAEIRLALQDVFDTRARLSELSERMADADPQSGGYRALSAEYDRCTAEYAALDGYSADVRIETVLNGLGFGGFDRQMSVKNLSGGEKIRFAIAKTLLQNPELLLLDEPTNHLDFQMLAWLESYLAAYKGAVIVVSHDRYFLDSVAKDICELERGRLVRYKGGYSAFLVQKEERVRTLEKAYQKQQTQLAAMREYVQKNLARSSSTNSVGSRVKALEKAEEMELPNPRQPVAHFDFPYDYPPHKLVLELRNVGVHVGNRLSGKQLYDGVDLEIEKGEKLALVGPNGVGKSSLLKAILKKIPATGVIRLGGNVRVGYFDQELADLDLNCTVLEAVHRRFPAKTEHEIRSALARLLITDEAVYKRVRELSGANRAKVAFCILMFTRANFLILDEPTNHLDYTAKEALDDALRRFDGTMLVVSHDRYFLNSVPTMIAEMQPQGITLYQGKYDDYVAAKAQSVTNVSAENSKSKAVSEQKSAYVSARKNKAEERRRRARAAALQKEIEDGYRKLNALKAECELPDVAVNYARLSALTEEIEALTETVDALETEWLTLDE